MRRYWPTASAVANFIVGAVSDSIVAISDAFSIFLGSVFMVFIAGIASIIIGFILAIVALLLAYESYGRRIEATIKRKRSEVTRIFIEAR